MSEHTAENDAGLAVEIERVLRENGLTDRPDKYDSSIHSWRCEHPDRYGPCDCFAELVADLTRVIPPVEGKEAAWDEGYLRGTLDTTSDLEPADNPYREKQD